MAGFDDVNIFIGATNNVTPVLSEIKSQLAGFSAEVGATLSKLAMPITQDIFGTATKGTNLLKDAMGGIGSEVMRAQNSQQAFFDDYYKNVKGATKITNGLGKSMKNFRGQLIGAGLGVMFFGMAMKRAFDTAWKFGSKFFQDAMHSIEGTVTGFDMLRGAVSYLGFTIGQALEPVAEYLFPIILAIAQWVNEHQKLTAGLLIVLGVLGTLFMILGQLAIGIFALTQAWGLLGPMFTYIGGLIGALATSLGISVLSLIGIIAVALAVIYAMWVSNFGGIRDFFINTFDIIWETIKSVWGNIKNIFTNFIDFFKNVFSGDFDAAWKNLIEILKNVGAIILKLLVGLGAVIVNVFIFAINLVKDTLFLLLDFCVWLGKSLVNLFIDIGAGIAKALSNPLQNIIDKLNSFINWVNSTFGTSFATIDFNFTDAIDTAAQALKDLNNEAYDSVDAAIAAAREWATIPYISGDFVQQGLENVDNLLGTGNEAPVVNNINVTNNIQQQPGETGDDLAQSINDNIFRVTTGG